MSSDDNLKITKIKLNKTHLNTTKYVDSLVRSFYDAWYVYNIYTYISPVVGNVHMKR